MSTSDDEIQRAIALSLLDQKRPTPDTTDTEDEDEDEELLKAIEASKKEAKAGPSSQSSLSVPQPAAPVSPFIAERAELEKARLERQKRRMGEVEERGAPAKKQKMATVTRTETKSSTKPQLSPCPPQNTSAPSQASQDGFFWNGELRQNANKYVDPARDQKPVFRLTDIVGPKDEVAFAILSTYSLQLSWLYEFFDPRTPVILIAQPDEEGNRSIKNILPNWVKTTPFLRGGRGCMHVKMLLLFYKSSRLRVVIPTANLADYDWRDIENSVWLQDLRRRPDGAEHKASDFAIALETVLDTLNVPVALQSHLKTDHPNLPIKSIKDIARNWDWSKVSAHLIPSIAGKHEGFVGVLKTGHPALMKAVKAMRARTGDDRNLVLECQGSSVGLYSSNWLNEFHHSARGEPIQDWLKDQKPQRGKLPLPQIKILFPSLQTVEASALGYNGGGTMFCRKNQWEGKNYPKELFHDSNSKRGKVLMHSKMIIATYAEKKKKSGKSSKSGKSKRYETDSEDEIVETEEPINPTVTGWAYVGSHNFTPSAWGTLSGTPQSPVLNITNFELGVVFPLTSDRTADDVACWERPPRKYNLPKDKAWIQEEYLS